MSDMPYIAISGEPGFYSTAVVVGDDVRMKGGFFHYKRDAADHARGLHVTYGLPVVDETPSRKPKAP